MDDVQILLEAWENSTKAVGQLKGILEQYMKQTDVHSNTMQSELRRVTDTLNEVNTQLVASPFSKIVDAQSTANKVVEENQNTIKDFLANIQSEIVTFSDRWLESNKRYTVVYEWVIAKGKIDTENIKGKWAFYTAIVIALASVSVNILQVVSK